MNQADVKIQFVSASVIILLTLSQNVLNTDIQVGRSCCVSRSEVNRLRCQRKSISIIWPTALPLVTTCQE